MRTLLSTAAGLLGVALLGALLVGSGSPALAEGRDGPTSNVTVTVNRSEMTVLTGETFTFTSEVVNHGSGETGPLIANLNFVALDGSTYIDPEDWSPERTLSVAPVAAGSSATQTWTVKPVLAGEVAVYVVVLPEAPELAGAAPSAASPAIPLHVGEQRVLNPGGVLPVVLVVPAVLIAAFAALQVRWRRS